MSRLLTKTLIDKAMTNPWDLSNKVLYDLCKEYPEHSGQSEILAKVLIIGRSYAAAIERRKPKTKKLDEDFYIERVAPKIMNSQIDEWFESLRGFRSIHSKSIPTILEVHLKLTELFTEISGMEKRSLSSKYLHFHFPNLYFIYDSRAVKSVSKLKGYTGRVGKSTYISDNEYRKLFEKCVTIKKYIKDKHNINLSPRQIDNILLTIVEKT